MIGTPNVLLATVASARQSACSVFHVDNEKWSSLLKLLEVRCCSHLTFDILFNMLLIGKHVF
jgi:hypothetical protein